MNYGEVWKAAGIPQEQYKIASKELQDMREGRVHAVWQSAIDALKLIEEDGLSLLDMGCASGYFYEIFNTLLPGKFQYNGADFSQAMIDLAQQNYPDANYEVIDIRNIDKPSRKYDVVFSSAVLEHVPEWHQGLMELCRVAQKYLVLHKTPMEGVKPTHHSKKQVYNVEIIFNRFNRTEFVDAVISQGFELIHEEKTNPKSNNGYKVLVFRRVP